MSYLERVEAKKNVSRRSFVKASAAAGAMLAAAGMVGCSNMVEPTEALADTDAMATVGSDGRDVITGEWVSAACWHNCGGRCVNKALVRDGVVVRQKTDDSHEDSPEYFQQRSCPRGHSQRMQVFGADRLKYPMKRKNWSPDEPHGELRGKDEWERISWDEAFQYVGSELLKAYETYGPRSVLICGSSSAAVRPLNALGGGVSLTDTASFGVYSTDLSMLGLSGNDYSMSSNDRFDLLKSDMIVLHGANTAWSAGGSPAYLLLQAKLAGAQFVVIGPDSNATGQMLDARWIPVHSGTDIAFLMGVAYEMLKLDEEKGDIVDWDFLHTYAIGFDDESMPDGATENLKGYLLGEYDNTPKTAEWASEICGTPVEDIRWYAEALGKNNAVSLMHGYAAARCIGAEDLPQMFLAVGVMGGHIGKPGHCCGNISNESAANAGPSLLVAGDAGMPAQDTVVVDDYIPAPLAWQSILDKKYIYNGIRYAFMAPAEERDIDIHVIFHGYAASLQTSPDIRKGIEAHRSVDFVCAIAQFLNTQAKYSDIVLPCTTEWEREGGFAAGNRESIFVYKHVIDALYEAKSDQEIGFGIAGAMGLDADELYPLSEKQQFMNKLVGATMAKPDGSTVPLVAITQEDIDEWGCEATPQDGVVNLAEFLNRGCYQIERTEGDDYTYIAYKDFIEDPEANPLPSESGKFELYSQAKADSINNAGFTTTFKPYPTYQVPTIGFGSEGSEEYPFLCYNPHYYRRSHTVLDNVTWLREAWTQPVFLNRTDAMEKGIADGDTVRIYNQFGSVLRQATLLETIMPGQVGLPHGAWVDMDEDEINDLAGADNVLCGTIGDGMTVSGYNNYNVNYEKFDGEALVPDCERPQRIIEL